MELPKIDVPTYDLKLPSSGQDIVVRPFLVKEEKLLLMAVKSKDTQEIIKTTKQVINNCIISGGVNVDTLPFFDIDYLFIALRAKSIGETITLNFICQNEVDDKKCRGKFPIDIDIANVEIDKNDDIKKEIRFNDNLIFNMKYPSYSVMKTLNDQDDALDNKIKIIIASVERIFTNNQYYSNKDFSSDELKDFIENLTQEQFSKLEEFVENLPSFHVNASGKCLKCGKLHNVRYKDFVNFFQ